jgi:hypothetical protein
MFKSTNKFAATLLSALAVMAIAPATAFGEDSSSGPGGCAYTDADGYTIPLRNGDDVSVDGKIVSCRRGSIVVTMPPVRGSDGRGLLAGGGNLAVLAPVSITAPDPLKTPKRLVFDTVPIPIGTP